MPSDLTKYKLLAASKEDQLRTAINLEKGLETFCHMRVHLLEPIFRGVRGDDGKEEAKE